MELGRLLQLVLGVAINCERKQEHIQRIMGMGEMQQQTIKYAIQEVRLPFGLLPPLFKSSVIRPLLENDYIKTITRTIIHF